MCYVELCILIVIVAKLIIGGTVEHRAHGINAGSPHKTIGHLRTSFVIVRKAECWF
jgi:hypothetical protein